MAEILNKLIINGTEYQLSGSGGSGSGADGKDGNSVFIRYSADETGQDYTEKWSEGQNYIGIATGQTAPDHKSGYTWCKFIGEDGSGESADLSEYVKFADIGLGLTKDSKGKVTIYTHNSYGLNLGGTGLLMIQRATDEEIKDKTDLFKPIVPATANKAVKSVLIDLTDAEKTSACEWLGVNGSLGLKAITSSDFVNGMFSLGTGISESNYNIITNNGYSVSVGEKIKIVPNGYTVTLMIESVDDLSKVEKHLLIKPNITEEFEILSEYDGYVFIQVYNNGQKITPAGFDSEIIIGENKIDALDGRVGEIEKVMDNIPKTTLSASPRQKPFTRIINDCQTASDWRFTNTSTDISNIDTTNFIMGVQSLRTDKLMRCVENTYDLLNNDLVLKIKINSLPTGARLHLKLANTSDSSTSAVYEIDRGSDYYAPNDWIEYVIPYTAYRSIYGEGKVDFRKIDDVYLYASEGTVDFNLQYIGIRPKTLRNGIVTFTFDDGYKSQYTGIKTLAEKGITGTLFHIMEATTESSNGYLTVSELQDLVNHYGADIEVHGNPGYDQWDETELVEHWAKSQKWLKENGLGEGKYMAYPSGMYPDNVVQLAKAYFDSCRTIKSFVPLESYPPADRYRIHAVSAISDNNIDSVKTYIDKAVEGGAWLTLVFHKIGEGTGDSMDCSVDGLKAIADYAIESGVYIMNYAEVFDSGILAK